MRHKFGTSIRTINKYKSVAIRLCCIKEAASDYRFRNINLYKTLC